MKTDEPTECPICLEEVKPGAESRTSCGHVFHLHCAQSWFRTKNTCPVCRAELGRLTWTALFQLFMWEMLQEPVPPDTLDALFNPLYGPLSRQLYAEPVP